MKIRAAVIQMNSGSDRDKNLAAASSLLGEAVEEGAQLAALPENFACMRSEDDQFEPGEDFSGPIVTWSRQTARELGIFLLAGSFGEKTGDGAKVANTSILLDPNGEILAVYRKIHLFDADLEDGETHRESDLVIPGRTAVTAETPLGIMGLTVCYDLRFPELYRKLAAMGVIIIFAPSAFTYRTGKDHWKILIRARAIENQVFLLAPGQTGFHPRGRRTYGHSLIVDPWGRVLAEGGENEGAVVADLDCEKQIRIRRQLPVLNHRVSSLETER